MIWATVDFSDFYFVGRDCCSDADEYQGIREQIEAIVRGWAQ